MKNYYTIKEVAEILNLHYKTIWNHLRSGRIRGFYDSGWRISSEEVARQLHIRKMMELGISFKAAATLYDKTKAEEDAIKQKKMDEEKAAYLETLASLMHDTNKMNWSDNKDD